MLHKYYKNLFLSILRNNLEGEPSYNWFNVNALNLDWGVSKDEINEITKLSESELKSLSGKRSKVLGFLNWEYRKENEKLLYSLIPSREAIKAVKNTRWNPKVAELQIRIFRDLGVIWGKVDGFFWIKTFNELRKYQNKYGIRATWLVDDATLRQLKGNRGRGLDRGIRQKRHFIVRTSTEWRQILSNSIKRRLSLLRENKRLYGEIKKWLQTINRLEQEIKQEENFQKIGSFKANSNSVILVINR